jgi:hypothetical protein
MMEMTDELIAVAHSDEQHEPDDVIRLNRNLQETFELAGLASSRLASVAASCVPNEKPSNFLLTVAAAMREVERAAVIGTIGDAQVIALEVDLSEAIEMLNKLLGDE